VNLLYDTFYPALPIFAQNWMCTAAGFRRHSARFNRHYQHVLGDWERTVQLPLEELYEIQRERLTSLVRRARVHVPYYRDLPPPSDAADPKKAIDETLSGIPPLEKSEYRDEPEAFIARDAPRHRLFRGRTSGTTGTALRLFYTSEALAEEYATVWRMRRSCGLAGPFEANLTFNGNMIVPFAQAEPPFWRTNFYSHQTLFSLFHMTPANLRAYADGIHASDARYVEGYPSAIHLVARALLEGGRPLPRGKLAAVFTSSETLLAFQRATIEEAFQAPVRDRYGVSELGVSMTECAEGRLHVDMEFCIVEVEPIEETADSVTGPLLITGLSNPATPLLRYRIGDVGTRSKHPCPCGRAGDVFLEVDGRLEDYVLTPDGRWIGRLDHVFKEQVDVAEAQILQETPHAIEVLLVPRPSWSKASERRLMKEFRARLGDVIDVRIETVSAIPREPNGKFRAVKSRVGRLRR
jgi:phenylacetate-CoA ligase